MFKKYWDLLVNTSVNLIAKVKWTQTKLLSTEDVAELRQHLTNNYFVIATRRSNFLSCWFINMGHFFLTGRWGYYTHVLMNFEDTVTDDFDFRFIEAATVGVRYTTFDHIISGCDSIALIKPKNMTLSDWTIALDAAKKQLGKPYDTLFDISSTMKLSCVELVRIALMAQDDYMLKFPHFEARIARAKNLTPQMFLESPDFEVVWQVRK